jgi:hypothetical protein
MTGDDPAPLDDRLLDALVEDELDEPERRALLERLEAEPQGWKRCALAFLEAQCWRASAQAWAGDSRAEILVPAPGSRLASLAPAGRAHQGQGSSLLLRRLALAAGLLAAFGLGLAAQRGLEGWSNETHLAAQPSGSPPALQNIALAQGTQSVRPTVAEASLPMVVEIGQAGEGVFQVPVLASPGPGGQWPEGSSQPLPEYLLRQWSQQGYQVEQQTKLVSMPLPDGQRVGIPVEDVKLHFVGRPTY